MSGEAHITGIDHINLRTSPSRLDEVGRFYEQLLGLTIGRRTGSTTSAGSWLYLGSHPVIHLSARSAEDAAPRSAGDDPAVLGFDHVAFGARGVRDFERKLAAAHVAYQLFERPTMTQIVFNDPLGTKVELNFAAAEDR